MDIIRFKQSQKFRVIVGLASVYTTAKQIRYGIGDLPKCNAAVQKALDALEYSRNTQGESGIKGTWEGLQVQLDMV